MRSGVLTQQANVLLSRITNEMKPEREQHLDEVYAFEERLMKAFSVITPNPSIESTPPTEQHITPSVNATVNNQVTLEVLQLLKDLKSDTGHKRKNMNADSEVEQKQTGFTDLNRSSKRVRYNITKYCYSHGVCGHESKEYKYKKDGHKNNATFTHKIGGSTEFCQKCT